MADTQIEWTDKTWNPTTGCDRVSPGCGLPLDDGTEHGDCYALTLAKRLKGMGSAKYQNDGDPVTSGPGFLATEHESDLDAPLRWRKPAKVFVNSMSDLFHERISDEFIAKVFAVMASTPRHTYQVLTKRHGRMRSLLSRDEFRVAVKDAHFLMRLSGLIKGWPLVINVWPLPNVWLGVSVENQKWADIRIPFLRDTPAAVRFLSCEPLLGPLSLRRHLVCDMCKVAHVFGSCDRSVRLAKLTAPVRRIDWAIAGGESGPNALPMQADWARLLRDECVETGVAFLFKQWGGIRPKTGGRELDGRTWDEFPEVSR
jgi:protein gp37